MSDLIPIEDQFGNVPSRYEVLSNCLFCGGDKIKSDFYIQKNIHSSQRFPTGTESEWVSTLFISHCEECGLQFQNPRPSEKDLLSVIDNTYPLRPINEKLAYLFKIDIDIINRHNGVKKGSILDVGCNTGDFLNMVKDDFGHIAGCDPMKRGLEAAKEWHGLENLYLGTIEDVPLEPGFDVITALDCFEHLHDVRKFLIEAKQRLNPGGILYFRTLRNDGPTAKRVGKYWFGYSIWHQIYPTLDMVKDLMAEFDLQLEEVVIGRTEEAYKIQADKFVKMMKRSRFLFFLPRYRKFLGELKSFKRFFAFYGDEYSMVVRKKA